MNPVENSDGGGHCGLSIVIFEFYIINGIHISPQKTHIIINCHCDNHKYFQNTRPCIINNAEANYVYMQAYE